MDLTIEQVARDLAFAGYAIRTQNAYARAVAQLREYCGKPLLDITRDEVRAFVESRRAVLGGSCLHIEMCALLFLFRRTLGKPELVSFIQLPRRHYKLPTVLSLEEVRTVLQGIRHPRYQAISMVMYGAGVRVREAIALEVGDIDGARGVLRIRNGKGGQAREAMLSASLYTWLRAYWARERPPLPFLFASPTTGKLPTYNSVREALIGAAFDTRIKKHVTPHVLRHSFATHLLEAGHDTHVIGALLGHVALSSTARYARVTRKVVRATPSPLDLLPSR